MGFWSIVQSVAGLASVVLVVIGFRKNDRKVLLAAWICLFIAEWSTTGFLEAFAEGYDAARGS